MPDETECIWCDRVWALFGLVAGIGVAFVAVDLLTGGALTKSLTQRVPKLAAVIDLPAQDGTDVG